MEENENENENSHEFNSISMKIFSDPLFSTIISLYILILLYFPKILFKIISFPVLTITLTLLLALLRFGATQRNKETKESTSGFVHQDQKRVTSKFDPDPFFEESFVEWNVRAPLEVIYEEAESEENNETDHDIDKDPTRFANERYPSLSLYYPESDSDSSSDDDFLAMGNWGSPESEGFKWEDEDREGLIEIALDGENNNNKRRFDFDMGNFHGEEENNLIEIDISPVRNDEKWRFSDEG